MPRPGPLLVAYDAECDSCCRLADRLRRRDRWGLLVFFPWSLFFPLALGRALGRRSGGILAPADRGDGGTLFPAVWALVVLVFFSLIRGKLVTYILPAAPAAR